jgi:competence protein ComEC
VSPEVRGLCYFLDIGQGTGIIVYLGDGRVIVIDGGPAEARRVPLTLLADLGVRRIEALVVSHNDGDHHGGAREILWAHRDKVQKVYFLVDRPLKDIKVLRSARRVDADRASRGRGSVEWCWLGRNPPGKIAELFQDRRLGVRLDILYPSFRANLEAMEGGEPNATSGILRLRCGKRSLVFPGDATVEAWKDVSRLLRNKPLICDILAVPHHGGIIWKGRSQRRIRDDLKWLYGEAVRSRYAVISVSTGNGEGHPRRESVRAIRDSSTDEKPVVLCTQITNRCCADPAAFRPGVVDRGIPSWSILNAGRDTACAGTILAEFGSETMTIRHVGRHQQAVDQLVKSGDAPLCRP